MKLWKSGIGLVSFHHFPLSLFSVKENESYSSEAIRQSQSLSGGTAADPEGSHVCIQTHLQSMPFEITHISNSSVFFLFQNLNVNWKLDNSML
jgi:hypothetical protein